MPSQDNIKKKAAELMGFSQKSVGKTNARKNFFPLVDSLNQSKSAVEITDHDKPVAVLLSYEHYIAMASKICMLAKESHTPYSPNLIGSVKIKSTDLDAASANVAKQFKQSLKKTANNL
ncbi:type II toxin-antitoxin system Phd/YefM family antitoxin [bacterium]|nr:type II toxin-antitoxin system Phd/YefM family antitoxin [bacterium]